MENAAVAAKAFLVLRQSQESEETRRTLRDLRLLVEKLIRNDGDAGLLFKLFRVKPGYKQNREKQIAELRTTS